MRDQSPIAIMTIVFSWEMHTGTSDPRGIVLVKGQDLPPIKMRAECRAVIEALLDLDEVVFVILPPVYGQNMIDVGRMGEASEDAIMLRVGAALRGFNISVVNRPV